MAVLAKQKPVVAKAQETVVKRGRTVWKAMWNLRRRKRRRWRALTGTTATS